VPAPVACTQIAKKNKKDREKISGVLSYPTDSNERKIGGFELPLMYLLE